MATLLAHITVANGAEVRFEEIARSLFEQTHSSEPYVRQYEYWRGAEPRLYYALVACDDFRSFIRHQTSEHHEAASPALGRVIETIHLEWIDPVAGASTLAPTENQQALPGADELTVAYTTRYAAQIASWWLALR